MRLFRPRLFHLLPLLIASPLFAQSVADLETCLRQLAINPQETYRVRDVRLRKGDVSLYLNEGAISFATPVAGHIVAALFTTVGVDAGDGELLLMPPNPAERASLAFFAKTPNLDEHFSSAVFFFTDNTRREILSQLVDPEQHRAPKIATSIAATADQVLQSNADEVKLRMIRSLLSGPGAGNEFFFSVILGHTLGPFSFLYDPSDIEPILVGASRQNPSPRFQLWTAYRPGGMPPPEQTPPVISNYQVDAEIQPDLSLHANASFDWRASPGDGRAIHLFLSRKLEVQSATLDGKAVEFLHTYEPNFEGRESDIDLLLAPAKPVEPGRTYRIDVQYSGSVIHQVSANSYFVEERNVWYPHSSPMLTTFDLTFHLPSQFDLVATGDLVSDEVANGTRTVHRRAPSPEQLAGFNLGQYHSKAVETDGYKIECYSAEATGFENSDIPSKCAGIVHQYTAQWVKLPYHTLAVTPISGYFGQGFPGLIYLSQTAYLAAKDRPAEVRNARGNSFFEDVLLPHELAHQWWGNLVSAASYRSDWLMESMANYSALQMVEAEKGRLALNELLDQYRNDLLAKDADGSTFESAGPVDFGSRLLNTRGQQAWLVVEYEKGTWVLHMLRERMGAQRFHDMQLALLKDYSGRAITNEQFREVASEFIPRGQPDRKLDGFFDTWVYGTGLPVVRKNRSTVTVTQVADDFTFDMPLTCKLVSGANQTHWVHLTQGDNQIPGAMANCQLPDPTEFLYLPNDSKR